MPEAVVSLLLLLIELLEIVGAGFLVAGFVVATLVCLRQTLRRGPTTAIESYRQALGRSILIGLEILVAATIIKTITVEPSIESLGRLAVMIGVRTALGWTTVLEMTGRWPWQSSRRGATED
jgi:uncharacterized membrane protein